MRLLDKDFGTPPIDHFDPKDSVTLSIDGQTVSVPSGTSIMRAAAMLDLEIPKLCATDSLASFGSCRMCMVQIEGRNGYVAACTEPVAEDIQVVTQNDAIADLRRGVMELYISDHPLDCLTCSANGDCELQDVAGQVGLREVRYEEGANHLEETKDESNPYFTFDPSKCIVCSRCVRACDEIQGTFALTVDDRGFASKISTGADSFFDSECVSCGACVQACPTATLMEKTVIEHGVPDRTVLTTCGYCGVGCSFKAEMKGDQVVRMVPDKSGKANHGASCVKGRFAWGYANHQERIYKPMIRDSIDDPWQEVSWERAVQETAKRLTDIQAKFGRKSIGAVSSSRVTIEEIYVVQKLVRTAFANNNIDTCARVCHSPTGYGLIQTFGTAAGTQDFDSVEKSDLILLIGANPTQGHPVFASRIKQRLREGAKIIVADPREIDFVRSPHVEAAVHVPLKPGTNLPFINALAHVIVTEELCDMDFVKSRCEFDSFEDWCDFIRQEENSPESVAEICGVSAESLRNAAHLYAAAPNASVYYGLGVTEHSQGSAMVMGMANLAMATGNIGRPGVGINPLRGQNNVQGSTDVGSFPHELPGHRPVVSEAVRSSFNELWGITLDDEPGLRIPNMFDGAVAGTFKGMYIQGEDFAQSDPNTKHVEEALTAMDCVIVQDLFLTETAKFAHIFLPGTSFLEKDGTFVNAERRFNRVRPAIAAKTEKEEWQVTCEIAQAMGYDMSYESPAEILDELAKSTPDFERLSFDHLDDVHSAQWPVTHESPEGTPVMHVDEFVRGKGLFKITEYVPTKERTNRKFPLLLTTGRKLAHYNVGTQTRRTENTVWLDEDVLEIHPSDAELRGIRTADWVSIRSRVGEITLRAEVTEKVVPGVVYTTFHYPSTGTNVITTSLSDEFTNCPEYKVTAVEIAPANHQADWQLDFNERREQQVELLPVGK
ncbi:MAG: formate dehydrogenase subunit alpha [Gammaproteobacteria bacterium]|nr:formate dehydrogenase subunit alpha [Gammaproteobacteria bacterium]